MPENQTHTDRCPDFGHLFFLPVPPCTPLRYDTEDKRRCGVEGRCRCMRNVRSTGPLWAVKTGYIVVSALFCVLGVVLLITAERCVPWIGRALGIGMVICGAIKLGGYFSKDLFRLAFENDLSSGILMLVLGASLLLHTEGSLSFFCTVLGILILTDGL